LKNLGTRISWLMAGSGAERVVAFDWIRGRVGSRENPDGMRSLIHAVLALTTSCAILDVLVLWRHDWMGWGVFAFVHTIWVAAFMVASVLNVGFLETPDGVQMKGLGGPNVLTLIRGFLLPTLIYLIVAGDFVLVVFGYALLMFTDVIDGWWARRSGGQSKLGIVLDPIVDLLFHLAVFVSLVYVGQLGPEVLVLALLRGGLLIVGTGLLYFWKGQVRIQPTPLGKGTGFLTTVLTIALLALAAFAPGEGAGGWVRGLRTTLTVLLGISVLHVLAIGAINLGRPSVDEGPASASDG
jgi:phosphatidylglycerophosphate synthase